jgi:3-hexulose-6-phosphate synthase
MKLQIALDLTNKKEAFRICRKVVKYIDIIELGTPLIKSEGINIIKYFKRFKKPIVADLKTMDTGFLEAELAFKYRADITTVCACADNSTILGAIKIAKKYKKKVLVDLISVKDVTKRAKEVLKLGPDYICIHTGIDVQKKGKSPLEDLKKVSKIIKKNKISVAGGINLKNIDKILKYKPEIIIVGSAITKSKNPEIAAKSLKEKLK